MPRYSTWIIEHTVMEMPARDLSGAAKIVWHYIFNECGGPGQVEIRLVDLQAHLGLSCSQARRHTARLLDVGLLADFKWTGSGRFSVSVGLPYESPIPL